MTKKKDTADLREQISTAVTTSDPDLPPVGSLTGHVGETEENLLSRYAQAHRDGDDDAIASLGARLLFSQDTIRLHAIAVAERAKLSKIAAGLDAAEAEIKRIKSEQIKLGRIVPRSMEDSESLATRLEESGRNLREAEAARDLAFISKIKAKHLEWWSGPLFDLPESSQSISLYNDMATAREADRLGIQSYSPKSWRGRNPEAESQPVRRLVSTARANLPRRNEI